MCGFAGFIYPRATNSQYLSDSVEKMALALEHRGPDDSGSWIDPNSGIAMAHRRLSVIDLTEAGHQPMHSKDGRFVLVYNGEIYNQADTVVSLENEFGFHNWRGHSDTEVLLEAICRWGIEKALKEINGMFAFALWDRKESRLFLARDRLGEKPLYYGWNKGIFYFGSELTAIANHPDWSGRVDQEALSMYLRYNCVPAPWSIYQGIFKLPQSHYVTIDLCCDRSADPVCYWQLDKYANENFRDRGASSIQLMDQLEDLLLDSVGRRMEADVPLGAFLSGGYDSSLVVALMQRLSSKPVKTFTIGFEDRQFNEANHASRVAAELGADHLEFYVSPRKALDVVPKLSSIFDEPFSDSSQIPTFLVSELARKDVTVCLSGDGGDELFGGYNRHVFGPNIWKRVHNIPEGLRRILSAGVGAVASSGVDNISKILPSRIRMPNMATKLEKLSSALRCANGIDFYSDLTSHFKNPQSVMMDFQGSGGPLSFDFSRLEIPDLLEQMMFMDTMTYLPNDILTKVDRSSMAVSLEARVPLLDHRLVEFAWKIPAEFKVRDGSGKWLLRQVLYRYLPRDLVDRPKKGFGVPLNHWLKGELRDWAEELLSVKNLRDGGYFRVDVIRSMWKEHIEGKRRWEYHLWDILMFQAWLGQQRGLAH